MTLLQAIVTIIVAILGGAGGAFGFIQFMIKRKDDKEEKDIQKMIDNSINIVKQDIRKELNQGLIERGLEGKERFDINTKAIKKNATTLQEVLEIQKNTNEKFDKLAESITVLSDATAFNARITKACAEGIRGTTYDRILMVANKALRRGKITISEKTNLKQLYSSWIELQGEDDKINTLHEDCMKLHTIPDEENEI